MDALGNTHSFKADLEELAKQVTHSLNFLIVPLKHPFNYRQ